MTILEKISSMGDEVELNKQELLMLARELHIPNYTEPNFEYLLEQLFKVAPEKINELVRTTYLTRSCVLCGKEIVKNHAWTANSHLMSLEMFEKQFSKIKLCCNCVRIFTIRRCEICQHRQMCCDETGFIRKTDQEQQNCTDFLLLAQTQLKLESLSIDVYEEQEQEQEVQNKLRLSDIKIVTTHSRGLI